jgi:lipopolysaccharide export system permease protein
MIRYILGEMIPTFFLGVTVFVLVLLMFQALRLTEFVLIHGVKVATVALMMTYLSTSFLPILFPMSLLFTVLLTYGRLSADSEIVAFRAAGISMSSIISPAVILSLLVGTLSLQTSFHIAPWGNRQFEVLIAKLGATKPGVTLKEGTFSQGFFDLVVYANKVDSKRGKLEEVFIYDERNPKDPITVIAREGRLVLDPDKPGHRASLQLSNGDIHRGSLGHHTKINFSKYDIFLSDPVTESIRTKSTPSLSIDEIMGQLKELKQLKTSTASITSTASPPSAGENSDMGTQRRQLETELHKRIAIAFACILFALIGVGLGTVTNRRNEKGGGTVICVALIVSYYIVYMIAEGAARKGQLPPIVAMWAANTLFSIAAFWSLRRSWS